MSRLHHAQSRHYNDEDNDEKQINKKRKEKTQNENH